MPEASKRLALIICLILEFGVSVFIKQVFGSIFPQHWFCQHHELMQDGNDSDF